MNKISVTKTTSYNQEIVTQSVKRHFELLELDKLIKPDMKVLLKPNLLMKRKPEEITTTHPAVIAGIIICLKELGVTDITLADSPGGPYTKQALNGIYEVSGMKEVCEKYGAKLNVDFGSFEKRVENGKQVQSFKLINPVKSADIIINVAKLKTHAMTTLSGAVKNIFGTVPGLMKPEFHFRFPDKDDFCNMLLDLCETVKPNITLIDGVVSMEGDGPSGGTPRNTGLILSAKNPYLLDLAICSLIGLNAENVPTVANSIKRGLCPKDISKFEFVGDSFEFISDYKMPTVKGVDFMASVPKFLRKPLTPIANTLLSSKPVIRKKHCIGCAKCAESCPAKTISIQDKIAVIEYKKCIKCYCCHEMCPVKAIDIKRFRLFNI